MNNDNVQVLLNMVGDNKIFLADFCKSKGADEALAEDTLQELCLRIMENENFAQYLTNHTNILACMKAEMYFNLLDIYRRRKIHQKIVESQPAELLTAPPLQPDAILMEKDKERYIRARMDQCLKDLPPSISTIIYLRLRQGLTFREIALKLDRKLNQVYREYRDGLKLLRAALTDLHEEYKI